MSSDGDVEGRGDDAFDEHAFMAAMFGPSGGDLGTSDDSDNDLSAREPKAVVKSIGEGVDSEVEGGAEDSVKAKQKRLKEKPEKRKREKSGDVLASYEHYAHLLDQYDEVNKQKLPPEEAQGVREHKSKRRTKSARRA